MTVHSLTVEVWCGDCGPETGVRVVGVEHPEGASFTRINTVCDLCDCRQTYTMNVRPTVAAVAVVSDDTEKAA